MPNIIRRTYNWVLTWADSPYSMLALALIAFSESSFFPLPPDVLLLALVLGASEKYLLYASITTVASVVGGLAGYGIGYFVWHSLGKWLVTNVIGVELIQVVGKQDIALPTYIGEILNLEPAYLFQVFERFNAWIVFVFGLTPLPYKLVTICAGVAQVNIFVFVLASLFSRGIRFFAVAFIVYKLGEPAKTFIDKYFNLLSLIFVTLLVGGFIFLKFVF